MYNIEHPLTVLFWNLLDFTSMFIIFEIVIIIHIIINIFVC
jgi:hypothetical protein